MPKLYNYHIYPDFFDAQFSTKIYDFTIKNKSHFDKSKIGQNVIDEKIRKSVTLNDLGYLADEIKNRLIISLPDFFEKLKITPQNNIDIELQIAGSGKGAFFSSHIDTHVHQSKNKSRLISAVYYFHSLPKRFEGGELVLHPFEFLEGEDLKKVIPIVNNTLVIFPSFGKHEVLEVLGEEIEFEDFRFTINCWINRLANE